MLRSGRRSKYYLDKYRFETDPALLAGLGRLLAELRRASTRPRPSCWPGRSWARCRWRRWPRSRPGLPYLIVRKEAKDYGTAKRIEGVFSPDSGCAWSRTWSLRAARCSTRWPALRAAGLDVSAAICVVDRLEGGAEAIAAAGVRFVPLYTVADLGIGAAPEPG